MVNLFKHSHPNKAEPYNVTYKPGTVAYKDFFLKGN